MSKNPISAGASQIILHHVYQLHGAPQQIILDGGCNSLLNLLGSSHHPQTNGGCKLSIGTISQMLY